MELCKFAYDTFAYTYTRQLQRRDERSGKHLVQVGSITVVYPGLTFPPLSYGAFIPLSA